MIESSNESDRTAFLTEWNVLLVSGPVCKPYIAKSANRGQRACTIMQFGNRDTIAQGLADLVAYMRIELAEASAWTELHSELLTDPETGQHQLDVRYGVIA